MGKKESNEFSLDMKEKIMGEIRKKRIKMKSPTVFLAEKLGIESALLMLVVLGAFLFGVFLFFIKKTGLIKFMNFGFAGLKIFFMTIPYDYLALFLVSIVLATYLARRLDSPFCSFRNISCDKLIMALLAISLLLGAFFAFLGAEVFLKGWSKNKLPKEMAVYGKIKEISGNKIFLEDEYSNYGLIELVIGSDTVFLKRPDFAKGKFLRATGRRDKEGETYHFHAEKVLCCDED